MAEQITVVVDQPRTITNVTRQNVATSVQRTAQTTSLTRQQVGTVDRRPVEIVDRVPQTTTVELVGIQGPAGQAGSVITVDQPAGATLQGHFMVRSDGASLFPVDTTDPDHAAEVVGIAQGSVLAGQPASAQTGGPVTDSNWSWSPGVVWCGSDGRLTQTPPSLGWLMQVGRVVSPTTVDIDIEQPIYRG